MTGCGSPTLSVAIEARQTPLDAASRTVPATDRTPTLGCYTPCYRFLSAHMGTHNP